MAATTGSERAATSGSQPSSPNIVFIFVDQMRADVLGAAGNPIANTPNLDSLAQSSVLFSRCYTTAPLCVPARAAMMTGKYPFQTNILQNEVPSPDMPNHVRRVRDEASYTTMLVGKFHLHATGEHFDTYKPIVEQFGFTDCVELPGVKGAALFPSAYSDWLTASTPPGAHDKWASYIDYIDKYDWFSDPPDYDPWNLQTEDHLDQFCARTAADWLRDLTDDQPFYLQVNFPGPHKPFNGTSEFRDLYDIDSAFPDPILVVPTKPAPLVQQYLGIKFQEWTPGDQRKLAITYYGTVSLVDDAIGQILDALEETGHLDDTWIIFASDHGELLGDHSMTGKVVFYEGSAHVPLLIRPPGGTAPWTSDALVTTVDLTATILEIAGLDADETAPGISLVGKVTDGPDASDAQTHRTEIFGGDCGYYFLRDDRYRATWDPQKDEIQELYDLVEDPREVHDLRTNDELSDVRRDFLDRFAAIFEGWPVVDLRDKSYSGDGPTT